MMNETEVTSMLDDLAKKNPEKLQWKTSVVDLMKLLGIDSSHATREKLVASLNYAGDPNDSATLDIWLHKQILKKLGEHDGKVPAELKVKA